MTASRNESWCRRCFLQESYAAVGGGSHSRRSRLQLVIVLRGFDRRFGMENASISASESPSTANT